MKTNDIDNLLRLLIEEINKNEIHPLHKFCSYKYYTDFLFMVKTLFEHEYFNTQKKIKSFFNRMQFNSSFDEMKYYQWISELLFIYFALDHKLTFSTDKKLLPNSNKDIDLQIIEGDCQYNIEIKCPAFDACNSSDILGVNIPFRTEMNKDLFEEEKSMLNDDFIQPAIENSNGEFKDYKFKKIADEKLKDFLKSGQAKFSESENTSINILVIAVPIENFEDYWSYLYNSSTGLFVKEDNGICHPVEYDKVDIVYLASLVTGHKEPKDTYNSWQLASYCNLLCQNRFSQKFKNGFHKGYIGALKLLPNSTIMFENFYSAFSSYADMVSAPVQGLMFSSYFDKYYPHLWR